jgi:ABC-type nickel/cobalt efflux system permease component RcnA
MTVKRRFADRSMRAERRCPRLLCRTAAIIGLVMVASLALAHPLGNFSINHYTAIRIEPDALMLRYVVDMAEIPTFQELQDTRIVAQEEDPGLPAYLARRVEMLRAGLILELNGERLPIETEGSDVMFPPGAGSLPTLRLAARFRAHLSGTSAAAYELYYRDTNFPGRLGWKEIIATRAEGVAFVHSSAPEYDRSRALAEYSADLLNSPPQDVEARVVFTRDDGGRTSRQALSPVQPPPRPVRLAMSSRDSPQTAFTELVTTRQLSLGMVLVAVAVAAGLGAFHALEPGHGKAVVAAYLVGSRGTAWHAIMLGLIVTATHTAGVYILGIVTLFASRYVLPERLYPWLGVTSGLIIAGLGFSLFLRRYTGEGHAESHQHGHQHDHPHPHPPGAAHHPSHAHHPHHHHAPSGASWRQLLALGVTGGIVPCPAAVVVLLSALSMQRVGFGLLLIVAFSCGLALVLMAIGILMVYAQRLMSRFQADGVLTRRWLPLTSAAVMTMFGMAIAVQALVAAGIVRVQL